MGCQCSKLFSPRPVAPKPEPEVKIHRFPVPDEAKSLSSTSKKRRSDSSITYDRRTPSSHDSSELKHKEEEHEQKSIVLIEQTNDTRPKSSTASRADVRSAITVEDLSDNDSNSSDDFDKPVPDPILTSDPSTKNTKDDELMVVEDHHGHVEIVNADSDAFNSTLRQRRQKAIDHQPYRQQIESWSPKTLQQLEGLIQTLAKGKPTIEQHWLIFYWIACNIKYDAVSFLNGNIPSQTVENVFNTKMSVCEGYSRLYEHLCDHIGLSCEKISGYAKGFGHDDDPAATLSKTNHAWNAVQIDGHWYLLDSTWGTGHLNEQNRFQRELNTFYFLTPPSQFIYSHLPEANRWQLLRDPIDKQQFGNMPQLKSHYFTLNIELVSPRYQYHASLVVDKGYALVVIRSPPTIELLVHLNLNGEDIEGAEKILYDKEKQIYTCYFAPRSIGKHHISLFGKDTSSKSASFNQIMQFPLHVNKLPAKPISFPTTYKLFYDLGLQVMSPVDTHLIKLSDKMTHALVTIQAPADVVLTPGRLEHEDGTKVESGAQVYLDRQKNLWLCRFAPPKDGLYKAFIFGKKPPDSDSSSALVHFNIEATKIPQHPISFPKTWQSFHDLHLEIESPKNSSRVEWKENAAYAEVSIRSPNDVELSCTLQHNGSNVSDGNLAQFDVSRQLWQLLFAPQCEGDHQLVVFAKRTNEPKSTCAVQFDLQVTKVLSSMKFPTTYPLFHTHKCQIYEPLNGVLKKGSMVSIHSYIPNVSEVKIAIDGTWMKTEGYNNPMFKSEITVGAKDVTIYAKKASENSYTGLFMYSVTE